MVENGDEKASYNVALGEMTVWIPKQEKGQHFPDLDMLATLLEPKKKAMPGLIQVLDSSEESQGKEEEEICWDFPQTLASESSCARYGFNNQYSGFFSNFQPGQILQMLDVSCPESSSNEEREREKIIIENESFNEDHYICDFVDEGGLIQQIINQDFDFSLLSQFTEELNKKIIDLGNRDYIIENNSKSIYLGLIDILLAFLYDYRVTEREGNSESAWTICKISSTLSSLQSFSSLKDVLLSFLRRSLCFPIYRNWLLSVKIIKDLVCVLKEGKKVVLHLLMTLKDIIDRDEYKYCLSRIYITDYCIWIQRGR